ncbi:hypothetical protein BV20DRAFT_979395 [Pilatotrama ljubarskyi]|nr:hypothetical protein BV20DRAFT_979395 [Pilatotrama ljubarskyi]
MASRPLNLLTSTFLRCGRFWKMDCQVDSVTQSCSPVTDKHATGDLEKSAHASWRTSNRHPSQSTCATVASKRAMLDNLYAAQILYVSWQPTYNVTKVVRAREGITFEGSAGRSCEQIGICRGTAKPARAKVHSASRAGMLILLRSWRSSSRTECSHFILVMDSERRLQAYCGKMDEKTTLGGDWLWMVTLAGEEVHSERDRLSYLCLLYMVMLRQKQNVEQMTHADAGATVHGLILEAKARVIPVLDHDGYPRKPCTIPVSVLSLGCRETGISLHNTVTLGN